MHDIPEWLALDAPVTHVEYFAVENLETLSKECSTQLTRSLAGTSNSGSKEGTDFER